jgi:hypothetical protein
LDALVATAFFTAVSQRYEHFVAPYISSCLIADDAAQCEILVEASADFEARFAGSIEVLQHHFPGRWLIRPMERRYWWPPNAEMWCAQRFLNRPSIQLDYTYIGDVDVLVLDENIEHVHILHCEQLRLPYSNVIRPDSERLSGLHFVKTRPYFDVIDEAFIAGLLVRLAPHFSTLSNEAMLYQMMEQTFGLPTHPDPEVLQFRPTHGFHLSKNRQPMGSPGWGIIRSRIDKYDKLKRDGRWRDLVASTDDRYRALLTTLEATIDSQCRIE